MRISDWSSDVCSSDLFTERADKEGWPATRLLAALTEHEMAERDRRRIEGSVANEGGLFDPIRGDFSGARMPFSPKWQSSLSAAYSLPQGGVRWEERRGGKGGVGTWSIWGSPDQ